MDAVHKPYHRAWIADTVINVRQFLEEWRNALSCGDNGYMNSSFLKSTIAYDEYSEIEEQCGLDAMKCAYQEQVEPANSLVIPNGVELQTLKYQADDLKKRAKDTRYSGTHYITMKYCNYPPHKILNVDLSRFAFTPVVTPEVVMTVQICRPERRQDPKTSLIYTKLPAFHVEEEFLVLGCQRLCELRDKIDCVSDKAIPGEYSDYPIIETTVTCKDLYKSGFFYINGVFYNDMRDKDCRDYSDPIIKWSEIGNRGIGPFKKARMEETRFVDLSIQLGYPYVYVHQGECEHLIIFTDLRVFSEHDVNNRNAYPLYVQLKPSKRIFCMVCHAYTSSWVVYDNQRLPENPFFFCKNCFLSFNYDSNNQKIGNFRAYYFPDRTKST